MCQATNLSFDNACRFCAPTSETCAATFECPSGSFMDKGICIKCPAGCSECTSSSFCTACEAGTGISASPVVYPNPIDPAAQATQKCECIDGYFRDTSGGLETLVCGACTSPCETCSGSDTTCLTCVDTWFLHPTNPNECTQDCGGGYFGQTSDNTCTSCSSFCTECTDLDNCSACEATYLIFSNVNNVTDTASNPVGEQDTLRTTCKLESECNADDKFYVDDGDGICY